MRTSRHAVEFETAEFSITVEFTEEIQTVELATVAISRTSPSMTEAEETLLTMIRLLFILEEFTTL